MPKREFVIVAKGSLVRKDKFTKAHEHVEASEKVGTEKEVVMGRCRRHAAKDFLKVSMGERGFLLSGSAKSPHATCHCVGN